MGKRGATRSVANPCRIRILWGECKSAAASRRLLWGSGNRFRIFAEREGFEPSIRFNPYNGLAIHRLRPLSHLSCAMHRTLVTVSVQITFLLTRYSTHDCIGGE